ncbi:protein-L-isoaspartate O-methyltransferase family protein [Methylovirgula sp. 4M-Z18]|uniref:protein-L-isoaspartate O-methyltransferase family protein n=1 Tax=Methylovirgula sp. 4M-Z18 TaxID=2293567 RepID=UPI000E2F4554|nr:protein-L-isoaspartate O-methyltransferase [Methylovirgula sp. 4M-Z18]RFB80155.1 protein-L-isoaspartate O-methyltransferase [Methylovirgula sp. 4M-Z18]
MQDTFAAQRKMMVDGQLRTFDVLDLAVLEAFLTVPREDFLPESLRSVAYADREADLGTGRKLLAPMILARMIQAADVQPGAQVLDVAGGSGYSAAIFAALGAKVVALEETPELAGSARQLLGDSATVTTGYLEAGASAHAPYDLIFINGAVEEVPTALLDQLKDGGQLLCVLRQPAQVGRAAKACAFLRSGATLSHRELFDASAPNLAAFRRAPQFTF